MSIGGALGLSILAAALATLVYWLCGRSTLPAWAVMFLTLLVFGLVLLAGPTLTIQVGR